MSSWNQTSFRPHYNFSEYVLLEYSQSHLEAEASFLELQALSVTATIVWLATSVSTAARRAPVQACWRYAGTTVCTVRLVTRGTRNALARAVTCLALGNNHCRRGKSQCHMLCKWHRCIPDSSQDTGRSPPATTRWS